MAALRGSGADFSLQLWNLFWSGKRPENSDLPFRRPLLRVYFHINLPGTLSDNLSIATKTTTATSSTTTTNAPTQARDES